jgi:NTP pyrophosphatase (non-canonical NTP hydrolase)
MKNKVYKRIKYNGVEVEADVRYTYVELSEMVGEESVSEYINDGGFVEVSELKSTSTFDSYQSDTASTAKYPKEKALEYLSLGIASEAGEVAGKMKKWIRDGDSKTTEPEWKQSMASEIGDVLWYCARLADELGLSLSQIADDNMTKLLDRKARGVIGGSGDNR